MKHPYIVILIDPDIEDDPVVADRVCSVTVCSGNEDGTPRNVTEAMEAAQAKLSALDPMYAPEDYEVTHVIYRMQIVWSRPE